MHDDEMTVLCDADIAFDGVAARVKGAFKGGQGVFGGQGREAPVADEENAGSRLAEIHMALLLWGKRGKTPVPRLRGKSPVQYTFPVRQIKKKACPGG